MLSNFKDDLKLGRNAEYLVKRVLSELAVQYAFEVVGDQPEYYYKGDIIATGEDGSQTMIEVKNDSRIADSGNILCEEEVLYKDSGRIAKGNMHCESDIYCVVSEQARKIYILDFKKLQEIYKKGEYRIINHPEQTTFCYLLPIHRAKQWGALIKTICY